MGREDFLPQSVVSLVPSITELVIDLIGNQRVIGRTKFCIHPKEVVKQIFRIGGTKNVRVADVIDLAPDLVLANLEENDKEQVLAIAKHTPTVATNIKNVADNAQLIQDLGKLLDAQSRASIIQQETEIVLNSAPAQRTYRTVYLIWRKPYMSVGGDTFISSMLHHFGYENVFSDSDRYPSTDLEELKAIKPELVMLSSEPYPFKPEHIQELQQALPESKVLLVDGEAFSWYGSRIAKMGSYFQDLRNSL